MSATAAPQPQLRHLAFPMQSQLDCKQAEAIRDLQERLRSPSDVDLANAIKYNVLGTCQFSWRDIRIANKIFGPSKSAIEGKNIKRKSRMDQQDILLEDVPPEVMSEYRNLHLDIDMIYVHESAFLIIYLCSFTHV